MSESPGFSSFDNEDEAFEAVGAEVPLARPVQRMPMPMSRVRAVVELVMVAGCGFVGLVAGAIFLRSFDLVDERWLNAGSTATGGLFAVLACMLVLRIARHNFVTIGFRFDNFRADVGIGLLAMMGTYVVLMTVALTILLFRPGLLSDEPAGPKAIMETMPAMSPAVLIGVMTFVAFWEEVVFRGFLLTRLHALVGRWWLAIPLGSVPFGLGHIYQGWLAVTMVAGLGMILGSLFVWRKSLVPSLTFHLVNNVLTLMFLRSFMPDWQ